MRIGNMNALRGVRPVRGPRHRDIRWTARARELRARYRLRAPSITATLAGVGTIRVKVKPAAS